MPYTKILEIPIYGAFTIKIWGLMLAIGMLIGLKIAMSEAKRKKKDPNIVSDLFVWIVLSSVIGGRLLYVMLFWESYVNNPLDIFKIWEGGMVFYGGILAALAAIWIFCKKKNLKVWEILDILSPGFAIGIFFGRMGCFLIGDHIGKPVDWFPWGSYIASDPETIRHEVSAYLSLNGLVAFSLVWNLRHKLKKASQLTAVFLVYYSLTRFAFDFLRADDLTVVDPRYWSLTISQWLSLVIAILAVFQLYKTHKSVTIWERFKNFLS